MFRVFLAVKAEYKNKLGDELCIGVVDHFDKRLRTEGLFYNAELGYRSLEAKDFHDIPNEKIVELFKLETLVAEKIKSALKMKEV